MRRFCKLAVLVVCGALGASGQTNRTQLRNAYLATPLNANGLTLTNVSDIIGVGGTSLIAGGAAATNVVWSAAGTNVAGTTNGLVVTLGVPGLKVPAAGTNVAGTTNGQVVTFDVPGDPQVSWTLGTNNYGTTLLGHRAGQQHVPGFVGHPMTAFGHDAGRAAVHGDGSTMVGYRAGEFATEGQYSVFLGNATGAESTNAYNAVFVGYGAGEDTTEQAWGATIVGANAARYGPSNVSLSTIVGGGVHSATGVSWDGDNGWPANSQFGYAAGNLEHGWRNTYLGAYAGFGADAADVPLRASQWGVDNVAVGYAAGKAAGGADTTNSIAIGAGATVTANNQTVIGNTNTTQTVLCGTVTGSGSGLTNLVLDGYTTQTNLSLLFSNGAGGVLLQPLAQTAYFRAWSPDSRPLLQVGPTAVVVHTNATFQSTITGNGSGLTNLNGATALTSNSWWLATNAATVDTSTLQHGSSVLTNLVAGNGSLNGLLVNQGATNALTIESDGPGVSSANGRWNFQDAAGNGSGLTNLNASNLASGTIPNALMPATQTVTNVAITANGNWNGARLGITNSWLDSSASTLAPVSVRVTNYGSYSSPHLMDISICGTSLVSTAYFYGGGTAQYPSVSLAGLYTIGCSIIQPTSYLGLFSSGNGIQISGVNSYIGATCAGGRIEWTNAAGRFLYDGTNGLTHAGIALVVPSRTNNPPAFPSFVPGGVTLWTDGTNLCVTIKNHDTGILTTNKVTLSSYP